MKDKPTIMDSEVANYVVCPQAWYLKLGASKKWTASTEITDGVRQKREMVGEHEMMSKLQHYAKVVYLLLLVLVLVLFLTHPRRFIGGTPNDPTSVKQSAEDTSTEDLAVPQ